MERETIVLIHTVAGIMVFASGLMQILLKKGGNIHRNTGKVYLGTWIVVLISGAWLGSLLITILGVFGFYFGLTGGRLAALKQGSFSYADKGVVLSGLILSIIMLVYAVILFTQANISFGIIFTVFGLLFLMTTIRDTRKYVLNTSPESRYGKSDWFFEHFIRMYISFIAAITAFSSIQNLFGENTLNFLMPTVIGVILIRLTRKQYEKKMKIGKA